MNSLHDKRMRFAAEYLIDLNAAAAARRAGYSGESHAAAVQGHKLLQRPDVQAEIAKLKKERLERLDLSSERILTEIHEFAMSDPAQAFDEKGNLRPIQEMPVAIRRAISSIKVGATGVVEIKFWDKPRGLELLGKHSGMFVERVEVKDTTLSVEDRAKRVDELLRKGGLK